MVVYILSYLKINLNNEQKNDLIETRFTNLYMRIFTDYTQILSMTLKCLQNNIKFETNFQNILSIFAVVSQFFGDIFSFFSPVNCIISYILPSNINIFYFRFILLSIFLPIIVLTNDVLWKIHSICFKRKRKKHLLSSIMLLIYLIQPSLILEYFKYVDCVAIDGIFRVRTYLLEECWVGDHAFYFYCMVLPSLIIWALIYPLFMFYLLYSYNKKMQLSQRSNKILNLLSFFTDGLQEKYFYWEVCIMLQKYIFIIFAIFPSSSQTVLIFMVLSILVMLTLIFQITNMPCESKIANKICIFGNFIIYLTIMWMIFLIFYNNLMMQFFFVAILLCNNLLLFSRWGYDLFQIKKKGLTLQLLTLAHTFKRWISPKKTKPIRKKIFATCAAKNEIETIPTLNLTQQHKIKFDKVSTEKETAKV